MPNETRNKIGRTSKEQARSASKTAAGQRHAQKEERSKSRKSSRASKERVVSIAGSSENSRQKATKRRASKTQIEDSKKSEKKESKAGSTTVLSSVRDFFTNMNAPLRVLTLFIVVVLVIGAILYPIGCTYYQAMRQEQRYQAELDAVNQRNSTIQEENDALDTDEGVENQARQELGWVKDDERAVIVTNGDDGEGSGMPSQVDSEGIKAPRTWYYDILDIVFQYKS